METDTFSPKILLTALTAPVGVPVSSTSTISRGLPPSTPPFALISSNAIVMACFIRMPPAAMGPVTMLETPTLMGSPVAVDWAADPPAADSPPAGAAACLPGELLHPASDDTAIHAASVTPKIFFMFFFMFESSSSYLPVFLILLLRILTIY